MAHPKRRISKSRKRMKRSHNALRPEPVQRDPRSGAPLAGVLAALDDPLRVEKLPSGDVGRGPRGSDTVPSRTRRRSPQ